MADEKDIKKNFWEEAAGIKDEVIPPTQAAPVIPPTAAAPIISEPKELSDTELLELLNKRNIKVSSLEDLKPKPTEEETKAATEKRKNEAIAYSLQSGKLKKEELESVIQAESDKEKFLYNEFAQQLKEANHNISEDEIKDEWAAYTLSNLEDTDFKKTQRKKELNELAQLKLKNKYANFYNIDNEYSAYEQTQNQNTALKQKIEASFPVYKKDVQLATEKLRSQKFSVEDPQHPENNAEVEFSFSDEDLKELEDAYFSKDQIISRIQNGYTLESIINDGRLFLLNKHTNKLINKAAKDYNSIQQEKYLAGRHGITPKKELMIADTGDANTLKTTFWKDVLPTPEANPNVVKQ